MKKAVWADVVLRRLGRWLNYYSHDISVGYFGLHFVWSRYDSAQKVAPGYLLEDNDLVSHTTHTRECPVLSLGPASSQVFLQTVGSVAFLFNVSGSGNPIRDTHLLYLSK